MARQGTYRGKHSESRKHYRTTYIDHYRGLSNFGQTDVNRNRERGAWRLRDNQRSAWRD